jgi:hypothetical protein
MVTIKMFSYHYKLTHELAFSFPVHMTQTLVNTDPDDFKPYIPMCVMDTRKHIAYIHKLTTLCYQPTVLSLL